MIELVAVGVAGFVVGMTAYHQLLKRSPERLAALVAAANKIGKPIEDAIKKELNQ
jgi:hypothetical protein